MNRLFVLLFLLCGSVGAFGQSKLSPYARKLLSQREAGTVATRVESGNLVSAYIHLRPGAGTAVLAQYGVEVNQRVGDILTARIPVDSLEAVSALDEVAYVQTAVPVRGMMDKVRAATGVDLVHQGSELPQAYYGDGVVVGIIDSGFEYTHPNFYDTDRTTLRIKRVWEQGTTIGTPPDGFSYGTEFDTQEEILTAAGDVTTNSHGSHVAGIAAGADHEDCDYYGVACNADIVLVSMGGDNTENNVNLSDAIAYIYDYAESVGKPCVINMSLGNHAGPHDGTSTFDVLADELQGEGRLLVGSVGNFGGNKFHIAKTFTSAAQDSVRTFVDFRQGLSASTAGGDVEIWGDPGMEFTVNIYTYHTTNQEINGMLSIKVPAAEGEDQVEGELSGASGSVSLFSEVSPLNDKPHVLVSSAIRGLRAGMEVAISVVSQSDGVINLWGDNTYIGFTSGDLEGWTDGDDEMSLAEIGGTGHNIISVGAYVSRDSFTPEGYTSPVSTGEVLGHIATFSSKGPSADGRMKPDITAPGCYIVSSVSAYDASLTSYYLAKTGEWNGNNYYYAYMQGTSMAAPLVAGVVATWLQANPALTPEAVRNILRVTADTDEFTGDLAGGSNVWGYGKIDAWEGIKRAIDYENGIGESATRPAGNVLVGRDGGKHFRVCALVPADGLRVSVYQANGTEVLSRQLPAMRAGDDAALDLSALAEGIYLLRVSADGWSETEKIAVGD